MPELRVERDLKRNARGIVAGHPIKRDGFWEIPYTLNGARVAWARYTEAEMEEMKRRLVAFSKPTTPPVVTLPPVAPSIYWGARIDGAYYQANYGSANANDAPWAQADGATNNWDFFEAHAGKAVTHVHWGGSATAWPPNAYDTTAATRCRNRQAFGMYAFLCGVPGLTDIIANNATAKSYLGTFFAGVKSHGHPVMFRPWCEMNGGWYVWGDVSRGSAGTLTSGQFVTLWRNFWQICADVMRSGGVAGDGLGTNTGNVSFLWAPNVISATVSNPTPWYPGDAYVDWLGFDGYAYSGTYASPATIYNATYTAVAALHATKPICLSEFGVSAAIGSPGKAAWFNDFFDSWIPAHPRIRMLNYFNEAGSPTDPHIENPSGAQTAWATKIANAKFASNIVTAVTFPSAAKIPIPAEIPIPVADHYVSTTGSNGAAGTSAGTAWATLQYALDSAPAGSIIDVAPGAYAAFTLTRINTGARIRIRGYNLVTIANPCTFNGCKNFIFDNLRFEGGSYCRAGASLEPYENLDWYDCYSVGSVSNPTGAAAGWALGRGGVNCLWDRCTHRGGDYAVHMSVGSGSPPRSTGLVFRDSDFGGVVRQTMLVANFDGMTIVGGNVGDSLDITGTYHNDAIEIIGACANLTVDSVVLHQVTAGGTQGQVIFSQPAIGAIDGPITVVNCELSHDDPGTAALWQMQGAHNVVNLINATLGADGTPGRGVLLNAFTGTLNMRNSIMPSFDIWTTSPTVNRSYNLIGTNYAGTPGTGDVIGSDPLFVNAATGDYHLQAGSPAKATGSLTYAPTLDLDGSPRGASPSKGCYQ